MNKKITIEVPATWADVVPGTGAADQVVMGLKELVREQLPSKYEKWIESIGTMKNTGYMNDHQRKLANASPQLVKALVACRMYFGGKGEVDISDITNALCRAMPQDVVEEMLSQALLRDD